jgi:hypothetical protein
MYPLFLSDFKWNLKLLDFRGKKVKISNFIKIRLVEVEFFHSDSRTDTTKLIVTFRNFPNAPKHTLYIKPGNNKMHKSESNIYKKFSNTLTDFK